MTALYSVNLHVRAQQLPLLSVNTLVTRRLTWYLIGGVASFRLAGWDVSATLRSPPSFAVAHQYAALSFAHQPRHGLRATGDNADGSRVRRERQHHDCPDYISNGLRFLRAARAISGFADVGMGIGMVVWGLASVIIGEALVGSNRWD
jgi:putative ABC transport system permease protein